MSQKVFIGLSGGVDSSVSACLLKQAGFDVVGVFIKVWEPPAELLPVGCSWRDDRRDAMRVAALLDIPFLTLDLETEYKQDVVDYMIAEYQAGRTPNPDVMCNRQIKFGAFYNWARKQGADFVATGHYAQVHKNKDNIFELHMGVDQNKDQSYFLWTLSQAVLSHTMFPIGHLEKPKVRELAEKFKLPNADKKDSQGLCFVGQIDAKEFLQEFIDLKPGQVTNEAGEIIGTHDGVMFYTLGQRQGFTITKKTPNDEPFFVVGKNVTENILIVSHQKLNGEVTNNQVSLKEVNWNTNQAPDIEKTYEVRGRYRQALKLGHLSLKNNLWQARVDDLVEPLTPGQSLVVYSDTQCLGGGIID
jgi:tRNA-specific 2-thiouridylase